VFGPRLQGSPHHFRVGGAGGRDRCAVFSIVSSTLGGDSSPWATGTYLALLARAGTRLSCGIGALLASLLGPRSPGLANDHEGWLPRPHPKRQWMELEKSTKSSAGRQLADHRPALVIVSRSWGFLLLKNLEPKALGVVAPHHCVVGQPGTELQSAWIILERRPHITWRWRRGIRHCWFGYSVLDMGDRSRWIDISGRWLGGRRTTHNRGP